ncbi:MAG: hypothetical protein ACKOEE_17095, partial [Tagaea sp.]
MREKFKRAYAELSAKSRLAGRKAKSAHQTLAALLAVSGVAFGYLSSSFESLPDGTVPWVVAGSLLFTGTLYWIVNTSPLVVEQIGAIAEVEKAFADTEAAARYGATFVAWASASAALIERKMRLSTFDEAALHEAVR